MTKSTTLTSILTLCGLVTALTSGCKQSPHCAELGNCGGPVPIGDWALKPGFGACQEDLYIPPPDPRLIGGADIPAARTPPPEPALYDWCDNLVTSSGNAVQARAANFYAEDPPVGAATISLLADGRWSAGITRTGTFSLDFPAICIREFGAMDGRPIDPTDPTSAPANVCKQLEVPLRAAGTGNGADPNTTCEPNPNDPAGCLCFFDLSATGGPSGYYKVLNNNTLLFLPGTNFPQKVTYCNKGDSLELTGADGEYLFGTPGLRTMDLALVAPLPQ